MDDERFLGGALGSINVLFLRLLAKGRLATHVLLYMRTLVCSRPSLLSIRLGRRAFLEL